MSLRNLGILPLFSLLVACGSSAPGPNQIVIKNGENGSFSGTAGFGWTPEEVRKNVCSAPDGSSAMPKTFGIQKTDTHYVVKGTC